MNFEQVGEVFQEWFSELKIVIALDQHKGHCLVKDWSKHISLGSKTIQEIETQIDGSLVYSWRSEVSASILKNSNDGICLLSVVLRSLNYFWLASPNLYHELGCYLSEVIPDVAHLKLTDLNAHVDNHAENTRIDDSDLAFGGLCEVWKKIL